MPLKYEKSTETELVKSDERWSGEAEGFSFWIYRRHDGYVRIGAQPIDYRPVGKIPLFDFSPKSVEDVERFADEMPKVFKAIAIQMREAGLNDLRSKWDKYDDARKQWEEHFHNTGEALLPFPKYEHE